MNHYQQILGLSEEQRLDARERAAAMVMKAVGDKPSRDQFQNVTIEKFPQWMNHLILALCLVALIAAFTLSAMHVFHIGESTFYESIPNRLSAIVAGVASVLLAEVAQVLFSIALAVLPVSKVSSRLLYVSMAAATFIALVGNVQSAAPTHLFAWTLAILPPLLVLSTSYIIKEQMLGQIAQRHDNERAYQEALQNWQVAINQPEKHPSYSQRLANAIKQALIDANKSGTGQKARLELMQGFKSSDWRVLVLRELAQDDWYSSGKFDSLQSTEETSEPVNFTQLPLAEVQTVLSTNGNHSHN